MSYLQAICDSIYYGLSTTHIALTNLSVASNGIIGAIEEPEENCAMCLNGNCKNVSGLYMRPDVPKGYNFIAQIPQGACRILVQQLKPTRNIIALRYSNGTSILNGEWKFSGSNRVVEGAGTKFNYRKQDGTSLETVTSPGPLALPVEIMFFAHQLNPGIKYEYLLAIDGNSEQIAPPLLNPLPNDILPEPRRLDIPLNTLNQKDEAKPNPHRRYRNRRRFQWKISGLTPCSKSCGGGIQEPIIICVREHTQTPVPERRCSNVEKPNPHLIKCNTQQCILGSWGGRWGPCVGSCKQAVQYYVISCLQHLPNGQTITLDDNDCSPPKPEGHSRPCRLPGCEVDNELSVQPDDADDLRRLYKDWHASSWSPCSVSCGTGHRSRQVTCPTGLCHPEKRPADSEFCENGPCSESGLPSHWLLTEWSQCSEGCGTGNQTRRSFCSKDNCDDEPKPETIRACSSDKDCGGKWFTGPWGSCSDSCSGQPKEVREVYCVVKVRGQARISMDMTCSAHKPESERACRGSCVPSWYVGEWGACEGNCPSGMQKREVRCLDANEHESNYCNRSQMFRCQ
ncbi:ADAM-TS Spacer 1 [Popillia japonica]|uniref:ADAM-TS Spacer 1 n=1 Tax=Popillia japonica TaxID=7064 RepID=A0AAW1KGK8_POPJA